MSSTSVVVIDTRLPAILQHFTKDHDALAKAIERATEGLDAPRLSSESDAIMAELKRNLNGQTVNGFDQTQTFGPLRCKPRRSPSPTATVLLQAKLASVMLDRRCGWMHPGSRREHDSRWTPLKAAGDGLRQMPAARA